ncbi:alpha/beta hydrolase family protein [Paramaledivibacter caminithermalis]|jgi:alpha-beta hydrolase superfamily lysophospholipase|uniref:Serine aminopeptidase, S33 n=1 Tax=Paramaledivibacter caminithermalis (strain DSM 15212 / CIP 107654 / DViRD3) TaxID=1121301 RepID=A0A1M6SML7_PARC5|nr:alpha/beta hydrolase [Paramaledivibacter caminithermalis]SHK45972.1 Serine aminopeptidase, S33 [Paramaledivibacter caminithermalis DSM 15212]
MKVIIESKKNSNIPTLEIYSENTFEKRPLVFIMHGLGSSKERNVEYGYRLVQQGFFAVSFDAYMHGEQGTEEFKKLGYMEKFMRVFDVVEETTKYIDTMIEAYKDDKRIDADRIGLVGISMGGFIIYNYLANNKRDNIKAAVPIISCPYWSSNAKEFVKKNPEGRKYIHKEDYEYIESIEPINSLKTMKDFPLLMLNGVKDELISIKVVRESFDMLKGNYSNKDRIKLIEYQDAGHERAGGMIIDACKWLKEFL